MRTSGDDILTVLTHVGEDKQNGTEKMGNDDFVEFIGDGANAEHYQRLAELVEKTLDGLGLHLEAINVKPLLDGDGDQTGQVMVLVDVAVGTLAWKPRTINPSQVPFDEAVREMEAQEEKREIERLRQEYKDKFPGLGL